jgi:ligand-binding sensor domain-containing protein
MFPKSRLDIAHRMRVIIFFFCAFSFTSAVSQITAFNFRRLGSAEGLSDGIVHAFTQDKYGFVWIGTTYGLNRFDGFNVKTFFSKPGDSTSLLDNYVRSLYCDKNNNLWVGTMQGLCRYDYTTNKFIRYASPPFTINNIDQDRKGKIWLATNNGLWIVDKQKPVIKKFTLGNNPDFLKKFQCAVLEFTESPDGTWYMATSAGIKIFNPLTNFYDEIKHDVGKKFSLSSDLVYSVSIDSSGYLWAVCTSGQSILNKIDLKNHQIKYYDRFIDPGKKWATNTVNRVMTDKRGRVWTASSSSGLSLYDEKKDDFNDFSYDPYRPNSLSSNHNDPIYQDREGIIWVGSAGFGVSYFNPDKNLFSTFNPLLQTGSKTNAWCRSACEDKEGNLWLGIGGGVIRYDHNWQSFKIFANEDEKKPVLHYNSVRSLLADDFGDIWIGTARGLNRYHPSTGNMDFFTEKQGMPLAFFWMLAKDKGGGIWIGSTSGLFRYRKDSNTFDDLSKDEFLSKYAHRNVQALYVDRQNRLWIGLLNVGLVMYDIDQKHVRLLTIKDSLISDTRFSSFAEDKDGIIWIGSEQGLTAYDPGKNCSHFLSRETGLPSDRTNNIMVDSLNRVWIGTSNGLCMLSANRQRIKRFDINDGMLTNQFNEQAACRTRNGFFIYPTYKDFVVFRPEDYHDDMTTVPVYITSFKIADKEIATNTEALQKINLRYNQNFFSIALAGLNYMNASQCTYAYKLDPFDKDWVFTDKRELNYTNVPAGTYTFRYKVITDNPDWNVPEKTLELSIREIFYRTWWFRTLVLLAIGATVFEFYRYRLKQRERIGLLQNKAHLLEKEKTVVQFENLKQQLNPHFLFNSLTSLRSLIRVDPKTATHFLDGLSKTYRYLLKSGDNELVTLEEELNFVETFTDLQKTRFKEGLRVNILVDQSCYGKYIVPVTLQNLIENAIKHNTTNEESPLVIDILTEDNYIIVKNNLQRYRIVETSNKRGLASMCLLYKYLSDNAVIISENENYFMVKLPLI